VVDAEGKQASRFAPFIDATLANVATTQPASDALSKPDFMRVLDFVVTPQDADAKRTAKEVTAKIMDYYKRQGWIAP